MALKLIELNSAEGETILVGVEVPEETVGRVSKKGEPVIAKLDKSFDAVKDLVIQGCKPLTQAFQQLRQESQAKTAEVEFGINFTAQGSVYVVNASGQASLKVKVTWEFPQDGDKKK